MKAMTFSEAAAAMGAQTTLAGSFDAVTTDTRAIAQDGLFIALRGERFDGHSFAAQALAQGAAAVVTERDLGLGERQLLVADTHRALLALAGYYRSLFQIPVIGVTGSVGKTTTKEMIHTVLSAKYNTLKNEGNLNNEIGVPLTLFRLEKAHEAAVIEMGMNHPGEIAYLTGIAQPTIAVITNIGDAHLENMGSRENTLRAKCEIFERMPAGTPAVFSGDDALLTALTPDVSAKIAQGGHRILYVGTE
ncbi:MAG: UDP-N-acetylmuramoyl-tripeptide--D-alanyl-D-alanine ligase [Clostridia bacterium]|nr:UDP-N-acetylmuramoyl-tripeptide--D-alanyl-D-alanine ligase [Clostridia bacterium]